MLPRRKKLHIYKSGHYWYCYKYKGRKTTPLSAGGLTPIMAYENWLTYWGTAEEREKYFHAKFYTQYN